MLKSVIAGVLILTSFVYASELPELVVSAPGRLGGIVQNTSGSTFLWISCSNSTFPSSRAQILENSQGAEFQLVDAAECGEMKLMRYQQGNQRAEVYFSFGEQQSNDQVVDSYAIHQMRNARVEFLPERHFGHRDLANSAVYSFFFDSYAERVTGFHTSQTVIEQAGAAGIILLPATGIIDLFIVTPTKLIKKAIEAIRYRRTRRIFSLVRTMTDASLVESTDAVVVSKRSLRTLGMRIRKINRRN